MNLKLNLFDFKVHTLLCSLLRTLIPCSGITGKGRSPWTLPCSLHTLEREGVDPTPGLQGWALDPGPVVRPWSFLGHHD